MIEACFGGNAQSAILQKLRNYGVTLAVVCPAGSVKVSSRFGEMLAEERLRGQFGVFETRDAARASNIANTDRAMAMKPFSRLGR